MKGHQLARAHRLLYAFAGIAVIENPLAASTILTLILAGALIVVGAGGDGRTGVIIEGIYR